MEMGGKREREMYRHFHLIINMFPEYRVVCLALVNSLDPSIRMVLGQTLLAAHSAATTNPFAYCLPKKLGKLDFILQPPLQLPTGHKTQFGQLDVRGSL